MKLTNMKPYSKDLRLKVLKALDRGMPRREVAQILGVSMPTIKRWLKLLAPRNWGGWAKAFVLVLLAQKAWLWKKL